MNLENITAVSETDKQLAALLQMLRTNTESAVGALQQQFPDFCNQLLAREGLRYGTVCIACILLALAIVVVSCVKAKAQKDVEWFTMTLFFIVPAAVSVVNGYHWAATYIAPKAVLFDLLKDALK